MFAANGPKQNWGGNFSIRSIGGHSRKWEVTSRVGIREGDTRTLQLMSQMRLRDFPRLATLKPNEQAY
jgi:hypothetical protein